MKEYTSYDKDKLLWLKEELTEEYEEFKAQGLKLDMSRGKPGADKLSV